MQEEFERLEAEAQEPAFWEDVERAQGAMREKGRYQNTLEQMARLQTALDDAEVLAELARSEGEAALLLDADHELDAAEAEISRLEMMRMLGGENDKGGALISITAGAGGTESQDWAEMLLRMLLRYAERKAYVSQILDYQDGEEAGVKGVTLQVDGDYAFGMMKALSGVHRLVRISPFDSNARRHTSFASVFVFPVLDDSIEIDIKDADLRIDVYRSSGAGGQHVNKTESAVRITHLPTGIVVACQNERSQHKNRDTAMRVLRARLYDLEKQSQEKAMDAVNANKRAIDFGSQIISYVLHPYQMVKDHRSQYETSNTSAVLDGELEQIIKSYLLSSEGGEDPSDLLSSAGAKDPRK
jgi:peptide chain release factor 2